MPRPEFKKPDKAATPKSQATLTVNAFARSIVVSTKNLSALTDSTKATSRAMQSVSKAAEVMQKASSSFSSSPSSSKVSSSPSNSIGELSSQLGQLAVKMREAFSQALTPLTAISARLGAQFNAVAGTITTFARRVDNAMKFPAIDKFLEKVSNKLPEGFRKSTIEGLRQANKLKDAYDSLGDVASKSLSKLSRTKVPDFKMAVGSMGQLGSVTQTTTAHVKGLGREILAALGVFGAVYKVVQFFAGGIQGAMDLNETLSKTQEVFNKATDSIVENANRQAKAYGLPKRQLLDGAASIGLLAKAAKSTDAEAAKLSTRLVNLAADSSSFANDSLDVALQKIRSGLAGEAEPLRAYGVLLDEASVKQEALRLGLTTNAAALDQRSKVIARASLIERGLTTQSGDLARTQFSASNQFRKAGGGLENFATTIGQVLLPAVTSAITGFNDLLGSIVEGFEANKSTFESWGQKIKSVFDTAGVVIRNFDLIWDIAKIKAREFVINVGEYVGTIPANFMPITGYIGENWSKLLIDLASAAASAFTNIAKNLNNLGTAIGTFIGDPTRGFEFKWTPLLDGFKATAGKLPELIKPALTSLQSEIDAKGAQIAAREETRAKEIQALQDAAKRKAPAELAKTPGSNFAEVAEEGSKEAYSAILKFQGRDSSKKPLDTIADTSKKQLEVQIQQRDFLSRIGVPQVPNGFAF